MLPKIHILVLALTIITHEIYGDNLKLPPRVEGKPNLLDSFIPAGMQIIAHLTDLMKYDLKPSQGPTTTTTSTVRPTPSHKPGLYAPEMPPGPGGYNNRGGISYEEYVQRLQNPSYNYFDRYRNPLVEESEENVASIDTLKEDGKYRSYQQLIPDEIDLLVGQNIGDLLRLVNRIDDEGGNTRRDDDRVQFFSQKYDDDRDVRVYIRQKKAPPTRAYVSLLSLYDLLNKESKKLGLNKYQGYALNILKVLMETSDGTSANQLKIVLEKIVERREVKQANLLMKMENIIKDLKIDNSYINDALRYIPPLQFTL